MTVLAATTAKKPTSEMEERARDAAIELGVEYWPRRNVTVTRVFQECGADRLLVADVDRWLLKDRVTKLAYHFHPNLAMIRGLNVRRGWRDVFLDAIAAQPGDHILDCTVGFAGEAALAAVAVGETGRVVGLESVPELAFVTRQGVGAFPLYPMALREGLRRVEVVTADYRDYLQRCESGSFDVVYFDPFFGERLPGSENSVSPLAVFGNTAAIDVESIHQARRVARRRVIIKTPRSEDFYLPDEIEEMVSEFVVGRHSRVVYHVIPPILCGKML